MGSTVPAPEYTGMDKYRVGLQLSLPLSSQPFSSALSLYPPIMEGMGSMLREPITVPVKPLTKDLSPLSKVSGVGILYDLFGCNGIQSLRLGWPIISPYHSGLSILAVRYHHLYFA